jgi:hypothetical protein
MASIRIIPRYKLLMLYDIRPDMYDPYYQFIMGEFVPELQNMGLYMLGAWHVTGNEYPARQVEFVSEDLETVREVFNSERFETLENRLKNFTARYERKLVRFRNGFQI